MAAKKISSVFVEPDTDGGDWGILTERDVLRAIDGDGAGALNKPVGGFAIRPLVSIPADEFVYRAITLMSGRNFRHLGVTGADGEVRAWDLAARQCVWSSGAAHVGSVKGLTLTRDGTDVLSCGERQIKRWRLEVAQSTGQRTQITLNEAKPPLETWTSSTSLNDVDASWHRKTAGAFCTAGADGLVELWDCARSQPLRKWTWGSDSVFKARWNPAEPSLLASTSRDRAATLFDSRAPTPLRKVILRSPCRALAWNPREPTCFVVGGEDHSCYTFDCRKLQRPRMVHEGHVSAVVDVAFAPTGKEFAAASTDKTVRLFPARGADAGRSRDVYHTSRMQALSSVRYTADATFVLTASEDFNLRVWKARASQRLGPISRREAFISSGTDWRTSRSRRRAAMKTTNNRLACAATGRNSPV